MEDNMNTIQDDMDFLINRMKEVHAENPNREEARIGKKIKLANLVLDDAIAEGCFEDFEAGTNRQIEMARVLNERLADYEYDKPRIIDMKIFVFNRSKDRRRSVREYKIEKTYVRGDVIFLKETLLSLRIDQVKGFLNMKRYKEIYEDISMRGEYVKRHKGGNVSIDISTSDKIDLDAKYVILGSKYFQGNHTLQNIPKDWFHLSNFNVDVHMETYNDTTGAEIIKLRMAKLPTKDHTMNKQAELKYEDDGTCKLYLPEGIVSNYGKILSSSVKENWSNVSGLDNPKYFFHEHGGAFLWIECELIKIAIGNDDIGQGIILCDTFNQNIKQDGDYIFDFTPMTKDQYTAMKPYLDLGLDIEYAKAIVSNGNNDDVINLWNCEWRKQYEANDTLIQLVLTRKATYRQVEYLNQIRSDFPNIVEQFVEAKIDYNWIKLVMDTGFAKSQEAVKALLEGVKPSDVAKILKIEVDEVSLALLESAFK